MAQNQQHKLGAFYLDQSSLECKAGCGFYGNPEWLGYCSICFKQLRQNQLANYNQQPIIYQQQQSPSSPLVYYPESRPMSAVEPKRLVGLGGDKSDYLSTSQLDSEPASITPPKSLQSLQQNQDQEQQQQQSSQKQHPSWWTQKLVMPGYDTLTNLHNTILNTAKSSFRTSPGSLNNTSTDNSSMHSVSQSEYLHNASSSSARKGSLQQPHFLYDVAWIDCLRHTNKFAKEFLTVERQLDKTINNLSDLVHDFYQTMNDRFENQLIYRGAAADQIELLNDNMERILNDRIYQVISARIINEDEEHNIAIQKRIKSLNWITVEHLEIDIDFQHPVVHDLLDKAICQMIEMNSRTSSIDKLECIVQCSKTIFELLQVNPTNGHSVPVSADHFLPVLVFVVIQANPPMLPADMKYLTRFSNPRRLMSGETGYYFTNLCCALEFIEKASGASLNISEEDFNKFVSGEAIPETKSQFNTYLCDGLRTMCSNDAALKDLKVRFVTRQSKFENLTEQLDVHLETNRAKLKEIKAFALNLKEKLKPKFPNFYLELKEQNKDFARKLLPSYMKQDSNLKKEETLVDIEPSDTEFLTITSNSSRLNNSQSQLNNRFVELNINDEFKSAGDISSSSLSPVEQLECNMTLLEPMLPEPIQPETSATSKSTNDEG